MTTSLGSVSPANLQINPALELSDGLEIDSGVLEAKGTDGGFIDDFNSSLDPLLWLATGGCSTSNGKLQITGGSVDGYSGDRKISTKLLGADANSGMLAGRYVLKIVCPDYGYWETRCGFVNNPNTYVSYTNGEFRIKGGSGSFSIQKRYSSIVTFTANVGDVICIIFDVTKDGNNTATMSYSVDDMETIVPCGFSANLFGYFTFESYYATHVIEWEMFGAYGYSASETAILPETDAYVVDTPAKLKKLVSVQHTIEESGNGGLINYQIQHKSDEDEGFKSLDGVIGEWTDLGVIDGTPLVLPDYLSRTNDKIIERYVYSGTGLVAYPKISSPIYVWESDVAAPSEPVITTAIATSESILTMLFADLLSDAYAIIFEIDINGAGSLPFSERGKIESGYGYMRFVGNQTTVERSGERNSTLESINGLQENDVVTITAFAVDEVGNQSAGTTKQVTMTGAQYLTMLTKIISETVTPTVVTDSVKGC